MKTVAFTGELRPGVNRETIVADMAKRLHITTEQAQKIVHAGKPMKFKRGLSAAKAATYQKVLEGLGLSIEVVDDGAPLTPAAEPRAPGENSEASRVEKAAESPPATADMESPAEEAEAAPSETMDERHTDDLSVLEETSTSSGDEEDVEPEQQDNDPSPELVSSDLWFSPGVWGWIILIGVGLLVAASALIEALIIQDETIPMDASTLNAGIWAFGGVLGVALVSYFLGWIVWLLGRKKPGGGQMVFCLMVLVLGAGAIWVNAEKLLGKMQHAAEQRASIIDVQTSFGSLMSERSKAYDAAAEKLALDVGAITGLQHIGQMRSALTVFRDASTKLGKVQLKGDKILAASLTHAGVEQYMVEQFLSGYRSSASANLAFNAATRQYESEVVEIWLDMLDLLESSWGRWEPDRRNSSIRSDDTELQERYNALVDQLGDAHRNAPQAATG